MEFSYILSNNILSDIDVSIFSYQVLEANTTIKPSKRSYYTFCFINDGKAIFNNGKTQFMLKKNQGILIFPNSILNYSVSADSPLQIITLGFFGISAPNFIEQTSINHTNPVFEYPVSEELLQYFSPKNQNTSDGKYLALSALFKVFSNLCTESFDKKSLYFNKALEYINKNISNPIQIDTLSSILGISRIHLYKIFEDNIHLSPKEFITNRKMITAYKFLKKGNLSVGEVAKLVGYADSFAFSKTFKKKYNISPKAIAEGKTPYVKVLDEESGECVWPAEITTKRAKNGKHCFVSNPYYNKDENIVEGWIFRAGHYHSAPLPRSLDISLITDNGKKGALSFWIFVENQHRITNWKIDDADWIRFGSSLEWDTDFQYWLGWHKQITKEGWNKIILPFGDSEWGHISGNPNYKNFCSFSMILSVDPTVKVFVSDIKVIATF